MNLSISNIAWDISDDNIVYACMKKYGYLGLEIAPTRIFPEDPYNKPEEAHIWAENLKEQHGFRISSMQSIWFGRQEKIFGSEHERKFLLDYTKKAIDFASVIGCGNLVFGCPRNRNMPDGIDGSIAIDFFKELGDYAAENGTVIGIEANPTIYHTNYINYTEQALGLIKQVNSTGFRLNLDVGAMIYNKESVSELEGNVDLINHVHISEPELKPIEKRVLHRELWDLLNAEGYNGYVSIEMGKMADMELVDDIMRYVRNI